MKKIEKNNNFEFIKKIVQSSNPPSIINESIVSALDGKRGKYINPRLYPKKINEEKDLPDINDYTCYLWFIDCCQFVRYCKYYSMINDTYNDTYNDIKNKTISNMWNDWNIKILSTLEQINKLNTIK